MPQLLSPLPFPSYPRGLSLTFVLRDKLLAVDLVGPVRVDRHTHLADVSVNLPAIVPGIRHKLISTQSRVLPPPLSPLSVCLSVCLSPLVPPSLCNFFQLSSFI